MGKFDLYNVSLKGNQPDVREINYDLDASFFKAIDEPEVSKGKVNIRLTIKKQIGRFQFAFDIEGTILVPCDRCLEDIEILVSSHEVLYVKFGDKYADEGDDMVVIPEDECAINLAWFIYEFIALQKPIKNVHPSGTCNKTMLTKLKKYRVIDENDTDEVDSGDVEIDDSIEEEAENIDPRWEKLKNILDNN